MREIKGHFREFNGKRVWIAEHEDPRAAAQAQPPKSAPKNLKPVNMPPAQAPKSVNQDDKVVQPWKHNHFGTHPQKPAMSTPFKVPGKTAPAPGPGPVMPGKWSWPMEGNPEAPKYTPEEQLAYFLKHNPQAKKHPKLDEKGQDAYIKNPSSATGADTWDDPTAVATWIPGGKAPSSLNGIKLAPWLNHPTTDEGWMEVEGQDSSIQEPPLPAGKAPAAGVVVEEPDGRVWVIHPTNQFGGYQASFPKGHVDGDDALQATAIREAFEESGLKVEITGFLDDVQRTTTTARYYTARRVGGTPTDCGWETQAVSLVPRSLLYHILNMATDHGLAEALGAGPRPKPKYVPPPKPPKGTPEEPESWWQDLDF
jgi:ADP-ribose pyrophosphatase YjhB (NUDIX family)